MEILLYSIMAVFTLIGLATAIRAAAYAVYKSSWKSDFYCVIRLCDEDYEITLRDAAEQIGWGALADSSGIIAVDMGLDKACADGAARLCEDYGITYCRAAELSALLTYIRTKSNEKQSD